MLKILVKTDEPSLLPLLRGYRKPGHDVTAVAADEPMSGLALP